MTVQDGRGGERKRVPVVEKYMYLGRIVDHAQHVAETAIDARVRTAFWGSWHSKREIWNSTNPTRAPKEHLLEVFVRPCLLPSC